jgi:hypothetical protein
MPIQSERNAALELVSSHIPITDAIEDARGSIPVLEETQWVAQDRTCLYARYPDPLTFSTLQPRNRFFFT